MVLSSLTCPNCGGPVQKEDKNCRYCNASINFSPDYKQVKLIGFPCPHCGTPAEKGDMFCSKCAASLVIKCPACRHDVPLTSAFCPNCRVNFTVTRLIEDANQKKSVMKTLFKEKEQQIRDEREKLIGRMRQTINQRADAASKEAEQIGDQNILQAAGYILIFIVSWIFAFIIPNQYVNPFVIFIFLSVGLYFLSVKLYPPFVKAKRRQKLLKEVVMLRNDDTWMKCLDSKDLSTLKQKDVECESKIAALKVEESQEVQKIDEWLKETVSSIH